MTHYKNETEYTITLKTDKGKIHHLKPGKEIKLTDDFFVKQRLFGKQYFTNIKNLEQ